jgi:hypothetical protein
MTILIITNSYDPTTDFVEEKMRKKGIPFFRLNSDDYLAKMCHSFKISNLSPLDLTTRYLDQETTDLNLINAIWYRRPVEPKLDNSLDGKQAQQFAIKETLYFQRCIWAILAQKTWVSHPNSIKQASLKLYQLSLAKQMGLSIPKSLATNDPNEARLFIGSCQSGVIVKPFAHSIVESDLGDTLIVYSNRLKSEDLEIISSVKYSMTFFQEEIPKKDEIRVTIFGKDIYAASIDSQSDENLAVDWRRMSPYPKKWTPFDLSDDLAEICIKMVKHLGLKFGAFDFIRTPNNEFVFLEVNPNGQWAWLEIELGIPMSDSLLKTLNVS